jgi:hypothetical protein
LKPPVVVQTKPIEQIPASPEKQDEDKGISVQKADKVQEDLWEAKFSVMGTYEELTALSNFLKENNYNFTTVEAHGKFGPVKIIFMISQRHLLNQTIKLIEEHNPTSFYSVEDVRYVKGALPGGENPFLSSFRGPFAKHSVSSHQKRK